MRQKGNTMKAQEQPPQEVLVVNVCKHCQLTLEEDGTGRWSCDSMHPEVLAQMDKQDDRRKDEEK